MWTYQNLCFAHARRSYDVLSDEYYKKDTDMDI